MAAFSLSEDVKNYLAMLVQRSVDAVFEGDSVDCPEPSALSKEDSAFVTQKLGSFVTLHLGGQLRGCIGTLVGIEPLNTNVWRMARAAAFEDPRFHPVTSEEWGKCTREISVLSKAEPCPDPESVETGRHGVILRYAGRSGVFLPQVATEQNWGRIDFLDHLCLKAGVPIGSWRKQDAQLYTFEATVFPA